MSGFALCPININLLAVLYRVLEDRPLALGQGRFAADIAFPGQWHMRIVRSDVPHGKISSIDAKSARGAARRPRSVDSCGRCSISRIFRFV